MVGLQVCITCLIILALSILSVSINSKRFQDEFQEIKAKESKQEYVMQSSAIFNITALEIYLGFLIVIIALVTGKFYLFFNR